MNMDPAWQAFLDRQAIEEVLRRYCRGVDRGDVDLIKTVYHPDAIDDHGIFKGLGTEFAEWIVDVLKDTVQCMHMIGNISIDLQGDVAFVETYCLSINDTGTEHQTVYNRYIDRFEKRADEWRIAARQVVFDVSRVEPATKRYGGTMGDALTWGRKDKEDPSYRR